MKRLLKCLVLLFFLAFIVRFELSLLGVYSSGYNIGKNTLYSDEFRTMNFSENGLNQIIKFSKKNHLNLENCISIIMIVNNYDLSKFDIKDYSLDEYKSDYNKLKNLKDFKNLKNAYKKTLGGIKYFPIALKKEENNISYEDSWGAERSSYGEKRSHEGTDIMDNQNKRGYLPVLSITDGTIENIGWLELGGYRIGIRSANGGYFYYAHLYSYADGLKEGDSVHAGELIGFMGDSGYGKDEGTIGQFDVHLHLGIYFNLENDEEISVNPYYILKNLESNIIEYDF